MDVSFIIPAHNEEVMIAAVIQAIHSAATGLGRSYEIVVADDASTDRTPQLATENGARVVRHERRQIAATRNLGARNSTGNILIFVDGDTLVTPGAVAQTVAAIAGGAVGGGAPFQFDGEVPLYVRILVPSSQAFCRWAKLTGGAYLFCTRRALDAVGGWDETFFAAEEIDLARRLKRKGRFVIVKDPVITSGRKLRTHSFREIMSLFAVGALRPSMLRQRAGLDFFYGERRTDPHRQA